MRKWIIAVCLVAVSATAAASEPFGLKGVLIGKPVDLQQLVDKLNYVAHDEVLSHACKATSCGSGTTSLAGASAEIIIQVDSDAILTSLGAKFSSASFLDVDEALRAKYGKPKQVDEQPEQNLAGARFQNKIEAWIDAGGNVMTIASHADATHGFLLIQTKSQIDRDKAQRAKTNRDI